MSIDRYEFVILGGGIIGLTIARELKLRSPKASVALVEKESEIGLHASGRNSGVLHAGIYYASDSYRASFCQSGAIQLKEYIETKGIHIKNCGKLIVSSSEIEHERMLKLYGRGVSNGISLELISKKEALKKEPFVQTYEGAIWSPDTSVVNIKEVLSALYCDLLEMGVKFYFNQMVDKVDVSQKTLNGPKGAIVSYDFLFNAAGAFADKVAHQFDVGLDYKLLPFKGMYRSLDPKIGEYLKTLIYPTPDPSFPFLGVHTNMSFNQQHFVGPSALPALGRENYKIFADLNLIESIEMLFSLSKVMYRSKEIRKHAFEEVKKLNIEYFSDQLQKLFNFPILNFVGEYKKCGIRPQLFSKKENKLIQDFKIIKAKQSVHVLNAISPAFTSSFAFAKHCVDSI